MAMWPFRRKSGRKRSRSGAAFSDAEGHPPRSLTDGAVTRAASKKKQRTESAKLQRRQRSLSFSPGRNDSIRVDRTDASHNSKGGPATARPAARSGRTGHPNDPDESAWARTPTLYHKRGGDHHPARRKSSKRRREDHDREAEIKAMSNFMPVRPAADAWTAGRPTKQGSKRTKTMGFGRQWDNPTSDVSLPLPDSIHSSLSSDSDHVAYKVSSLDALAPRPTLRYAPGARRAASRASVPAHPASQSRALTEQEAIPEHPIDQRKRIDDLVDNLDASDLRELMERDNRRRERQRQHEQERVERRLARRTEKQRIEAAEAKKSGSPVPQNLERGVVGRELVGLGIDPESTVVTSSKQRDSGGSGPMSDVEETRSKEPLASFHRTDTMPVEEPESDEPAPSPSPKRQEDVSELPQASKLAGILRSKKSRSKSTLHSDKERNILAEDESSRKGSETSNKATRLSFTRFLRWGGKNRRNSGPSSFSNTSREEMQAAVTAQSQSQTQAQAQAQALAKLQGEDVSSPGASYTGNYMASKAGSMVPKRTRSRFREDLPDFPLSPPDSRVQSPEAEPPLPMVTEHKSPTTEPEPINSVRYDTPTSGHRSIDSTQHTLPSVNKVYGAPSPEPHQSMSLASIDSEGSWLSGKVASRRTSTIRDSIARANRRDHGQADDSPTNSTHEDIDLADDEYLARLTPTGDPHAAAGGRRSEEGLPSSDEDDTMEESDARWGAVGARAHLVHNHRHDREKMHSRQGLLNIDSGDEESGSVPGTPASVERAQLARATSVHMGKGHARNFSAGSVKLLDITPRASLDTKARSRERRASGPMHL